MTQWDKILAGNSNLFLFLCKNASTVKVKQIQNVEIHVGDETFTIYCAISNNSGEPVMYEVNSGNVGGGELDQEVNNSEDMLNLQQAGINISFGTLFKILLWVK